MEKMVFKVTRKLSAATLFPTLTFISHVANHFLKNIYTFNKRIELKLRFWIILDF